MLFGLLALGIGHIYPCFSSGIEVWLSVKSYKSTFESKI